jgi:hypothetical protein
MPLCFQQPDPTDLVTLRVQVHTDMAIRSSRWRSQGITGMRISTIPGHRRSNNGQPTEGKGEIPEAATEIAECHARLH